MPELVKKENHNVAGRAALGLERVPALLWQTAVSPWLRIE
jgi:hypothetical protein